MTDLERELRKILERSPVERRITSGKCLGTIFIEIDREVAARDVLVFAATPQ